MTEQEVGALSPGLYIVYFFDDVGSESLAAIGVTLKNKRWLAPVNWCRTTTKQEDWDMVARAIPVKILR